MKVKCIICKNEFNSYIIECPICGNNILIDLEAIRIENITFMLEWYILEIEKIRGIKRW